MTLLGCSIVSFWYSFFFLLLTRRLVLEFFMDHLWLNTDGWILIFYTGKQALSPAIENSNTNIKIIKRRPNLPMIIPNIMYGIETGKGIPETYIPSEKIKVKEVLAKKLKELEDEGYSEEEIVEDLTLLAHESGFLLSHLVSEDDHNSERSLLQTIKEDFSSTPPGKHTQYGRNVPDSSHTQQLYHRRQQRPSKAAYCKQKSILEGGYRPWEKQEGAAAFVKSLDKKMVLSTWGLLYCGGSKPVEDTMRNISREYDIAFYPESFAW